jgi:hypothetical protein
MIYQNALNVPLPSTDPDDYQRVYDTFRNVATEPSREDLAPIKQVKRDTVTMNRPLTPWGHTRFHKTLALHIHDTTRPAGHGDEYPNYGIMDNEVDAKAWDGAR